MRPGAPHRPLQAEPPRRRRFLRILKQPNAVDPVLGRLAAVAADERDERAAPGQLARQESELHLGAAVAAGQVRVKERGSKRRVRQMLGGFIG